MNILFTRCVHKLGKINLINFKFPRMNISSDWKKVYNFICNSISLSLSLGAIIIPLRNRFPDSHLSPLQLCCKDLGYLHLRFHPTYQSRAYTVFNWTVSSEMIALAVRANCPRATTLRYLRMSFDRMRKIGRVETIVIIRPFGETKLIFWSKFSIEIFNMYVYIYIRISSKPRIQIE